MDETCSSAHAEAYYDKRIYLDSQRFGIGMAIPVTLQFSPMLDILCFQAHGGKLGIHGLLSCTSGITYDRLDTSHMEDVTNSVESEINQRPKR